LDKKIYDILLKIKTEIKDNSKQAIKSSKYQNVIYTDLAIEIVEKYFETI